ncbi:MAG TPA: HlyD family efflux transporter periplasmic adaptor subunit [Gammaproteobacteria bacterium]|nr:HlyD family efflux transporter periplasmic adaptor subunit [Gammaproteobacteria bacterium]
MVTCLALAAASLGLARRATDGSGVSTDDAYVRGNLVALTPQVSGTVVAINADDTDLVTQGEPLVVLDDTDAQLAVSAAKADLGATVRRVEQFYANAEQLKAAVRRSEVDFAKAEDDYRRRRGARPGSVSGEELKHARAALETARLSRTAARAQLEAAEALTQGVDAARHPEVMKAEARLRMAHLALERAQIRAPITGYVAHRTVQVGQRVVPGTPLLTIVPLARLWIEANFKEAELKHVRIGQPAVVTADFYGDDVEYHGRVVGLAAGTGSAFSLLPPQNATGNWIKIVQRLPVRIALDDAELSRHPLRVGLSMQVAIDTRKRGGAVLAGAAASHAVYASPVYHRGPDPAVEAEIVQILSANLVAPAVDSSAL